MQSIKEKLNKIKRAGERVLENKAVFVVSVLILSSLSSFALGHLSALEENKIPLSIQNANLASVLVPIETDVPALVLGGKYVASKNSDKYHAPWCSGAQRIKEENQIWFNSKEEAEKAGYTPASNCKGI
ncbi:MAG: hypothetical protein ABIG87_00775 [Patescibacteria group bacterium]